MANSNGRTKTRKRRKHYVPPKPNPDFPLTPHASGKWMKKIRGTLYYFGRWGHIKNGKMVRLPDDGWKDAYDIYKVQRDDLFAGRTPQIADSTNDETVKSLCNRFLTAMHVRLQAGRKMSPLMFAEYRATAERMAKALGKNTLVRNLRPADFATFAVALSNYGPVRRGTEVQKVKTIFKYGVTNELIAKEPNYGSEFKKPDRDEMRKHRASQGKRLFTAAEIREILDNASPELEAMVLLGINCAFGNTDVGTLPQSVVKLDKGWINYPRPKNGIERRCPLWPETVAALKAVMATRPKAKDAKDADAVFLTKRGERWMRETHSDAADPTEVKVAHVDQVGETFSRLLKRLDINGRKGLGFYTLRHTFRTVSDATKDFPAIRLVMGHGDDSIDADYREHIDNDRLQAIVQHVRSWLFGTEGGAA